MKSKQGDFQASACSDTLRARALLLRQIRSFFDERGFVEVQTPLLSADTVVDRHLDPLTVTVPEDPYQLSTGRQMYLQTSPEFLMKRLLASGLSAIYQITPAFRIGESGAHHNPEFTMLEWYRCGDDMQAGIALLSDFVATLLKRQAANVTSMNAIFERVANFQPLQESSAKLKQRCEAAGIAFPESLDADDWDSWFELLFAHWIQPTLGFDQPCIIHDFPATQAALAQVRPAELPVAERFELFVDGVELANGYHELLDAHELLHRNQKVNRQRCADGKRPLPDESRLLAAMRDGLPACSGVAVGVDRLVMLATEKKTLDEVLSFPIDRA